MNIAVNATLEGRRLLSRLNQPDELNFCRAFYDGSPAFRAFMKHAPTARTIQNIYDALDDYPLLKKGIEIEAASGIDNGKYVNLRRALMLTFHAFDNQMRDNREEEIIHHTLRNAEETAEIFGPAAGPQILEMIGHDLIEDGKIKVESPLIGRGKRRRVTSEDMPNLFDSETAEGIHDLSVDMSDVAKGTPWQKKVEIKKTRKDEQTPKLARKPYRLILKAIDSKDEVITNVQDAGARRLVIEDGYVISKRKGKKSGLEENLTKLRHRNQHQADYLRRLREHTPQVIVYGGKPIVLREVADKMEAEYKTVSDQYAAILATGEALPASPERRHMLRGAAAVLGAGLLVFRK